MSDGEKPVAGSQRLTELFSALKAVVAENPRLQALIREQEQDKRQVLLNMSSVLRMVEQDDNDDPSEDELLFQPRAIQGWMGAEAGEDCARKALPEPESGPPPSMNFFDRAFLKSLKIST